MGKCDRSSVLLHCYWCYSQYCYDFAVFSFRHIITTAAAASFTTTTIIIIIIIGVVVVVVVTIMTAITISNHAKVYGKFLNKWKELLLHIHSVESPSMVDPQWDIWYWGSKWNLHTDCWSAVGCEWGTTSVYFGITCVCFIPSRLPVFAVEPQSLLQDLLFLWKVSFEGHIQNLKKFMLV